MNNKIKVLIVDDSAFIRTAIERMLKDDSSIAVIGSAENGAEAVNMVLRLSPDVVTMDVEMPVMDGLQATKEIMRIKPTPILMVSSLTREGAQTTLDALDFGAVDYILKPGSSIGTSILKVRSELLTKVKAAAGSKPSHTRLDLSFATRRNVQESKVSKYIHRAVLIGASTGGPPAVQRIISCLPPNLNAPVIIAQHMPLSFTSAFASRLDAICPIKVKEASRGEIISNAVVYVCPGDHQTFIEKHPDGTYRFNIVPGYPNGEAFAPCISNLFSSAAEKFGRKAMGIILTGMGRDGSDGLMKIKEAGGITIAQDKQTSVVYGMPKVAADSGAAVYVLSLDMIPKEIEATVRKYNECR